MSQLNPVQTGIAICVIIWITVITIILMKHWQKKTETSGFTFIYITNLVLIHLIAAFGYILPSNWKGNEALMLEGFRESTYAIVAFGLGNVILAPFFVRSFSLPELKENINMDEAKLISQLPRLYFIAGAVFYFILAPNLYFPTITVLVTMGAQLIVVGICLLIWKAWREKNMIKLRNLLILSLIFPFVSIIRDGYLGYGAGMTIIIFIFTISFFRIKSRALIIGAFCIYLGLSFYQVYMRDREELRGLAWGGASFDKRIKALSATLSNPEWFNPLNSTHIERIEERINQNILIGSAVEYLQSGGNKYAYGKTLWEALVALIPRIFWREKNIFAGSGNIVSEYTGLVFSEDTSVGVGQIMEFYINFGRSGVIIGFLVLGIIIAIIDFKSGHYLIIYDLRKFALWFLPGIAFCNVGGSLVELTSSAGASVIVAYFVSKLKGIHYRLLLLSLFLYLIMRYLIQ